MIKIALTGSIGMGKSTTAAMFAAAGLPVFDADATIRALYAPGGGAIGPVGARFPAAIRDGGVDRTVLAALVLDDPEKIRALEAIVHPLVAAARASFLAEATAEGVPAVVFDIPLLFETGGEREADVVVVVSAPEPLQAARVLARPGMDEAKFAAIKARQMPDAEKRRRADFVIDTGLGLAAAQAQVEAVLAALNIPAKR